jgi:hypothetical protein
MQRIVIDIPDSKFSFFMELVNNLGFKKVKKLSRQQHEFVDDLQHSLEQVEQHLKGEIKLKTADQLYNEL